MTKASPPPATQVQWAHTMIPPVLAATQTKDVVDCTLYLKGFSYTTQDVVDFTKKLSNLVKHFWVSFTMA